MDEDLIIHTEPAGELAPHVRTTFADVMADPTINAAFGGKDGKLSPTQAGFAAAIISKMQDRLIEYINQAHQRELGLIGGFLQLYKAPVFTRTRAGSREKAAKETKPKPGRFSELFSWGNLIGGAGVLIVAGAFFLTNYYTKLSASYEEHWKAAESDSAKFKGLYEAEQKAGEALQAELARSRTDAEETRKLLANLSTVTADQQQNLLRSISALSEDRAQIAKQIASSSAEKKFQTLFDSAQKELTKLRQDNAGLSRRAEACVPTK